MGSRYYTRNGTKLPSVTTITGQLDKSDALIYWASNCVADKMLELVNAHRGRITKKVLRKHIKESRQNFREVSRVALDIGSEVHKAIERYLRKKTYKLNTKEAERGFDAFLDWLDTKEPQTIATEKTVWGDRWAGTCDWVCLLNGHKYVIDFKTSKRIYPEYRYQVAAYAHAEGATHCGILRLDKETGKPQWRDTSKTFAKDLEVFQLLVDLWWLTHPRAKAPH